MRSWSRLDRILLGLTLLILLGYCMLVGRPVFSFAWGVATWLITDPNQPNSDVVALLHLPAYQLAYPGAVLLGHSEQPPSWGESGTHYSAEVSKTFGIPAPVPAQASDQTILDWYDEQLQAHGWTPSFVGKNSIYSIEKHWRDGSYLLIVGIYDPKAIQLNKLPIDTAKYPLAFGVTLEG